MEPVNERSGQVSVATLELLNDSSRGMLSLIKPDGTLINIPEQIENEIVRPHKDSEKLSPMRKNEYGYVPNSIHGVDFASNEYVSQKTIIAIELRSLPNSEAEVILWVNRGNSLAVNMSNGNISYVENIPENEPDNNSNRSSKPISGKDIGKNIADLIRKSIYDQKNVEDAGGETEGPTDWLESGINEMNREKDWKRTQTLRFLNQFTEQSNHPRKRLEGYQFGLEERKDLLNFITQHKGQIVPLPPLSKQS